MEVFCYFLSPKEREITGEDKNFHTCALREIKDGFCGGGGVSCRFSNSSDNDFGGKSVMYNESEARRCPGFVPETDSERGERLKVAYRQFWESQK